MPYAVFWFATLVAALSLVALACAWAARIRYVVVRWGLISFAIFLPLPCYGLFTGFAWKFDKAPCFSMGWFWPLVALMIGYFLAAVIVVWRGGRKVSEGPNIQRTRAFYWKLRRLTVLCTVAVTTGLLTFYVVDWTVRQQLAELGREAQRLAKTLAPDAAELRNESADVYARAFASMPPFDEWSAECQLWLEDELPIDGKNDPEIVRFMNR